MGKKFFNAKARQNVKTIIDKSSENVQVEFAENAEYAGYDEANALILPSKKRATKIQKEKHIITRILSKKQRKKLEKVVDKKKKKEGRSALLESLAAVQIPVEELQKYTSLSQVQTVGLKNFSKIDEILNKRENVDSKKPRRISSIAGIKKRKRQAFLDGYRSAESSSEDEIDNAKKVKDYSVLGLTDESDYSEGENINELKENENVQEQEQEGQFEKSNSSENCINVEKNNVNNSILQKENINQEQNEINCGWIEESLPDTEYWSVAENLPLNTEWIEEDYNLKETINNDENQINSNWVIENCRNLLENEKKGTINEIERIPAKYIHVYRDPQIQAARLKLPILGEEQVIMETINENPIVILEGETGSGKTTQVPQFLYEAGYAEQKMIGITEPRRVAAISMSKRVANEMQLSDKEVSYLIRFEGNVTDKTKIKFMTDGVLLKEIESDYLLTKYSVIILDEAHERSVFTDILVGLLSRIVLLRNKKNMPLKLIIMSATLRVGDFTKNTKLFRTIPPVLKVESRQYSVTIHFQKRTPDDYVEEAYRKTVKIHSQLPEGGILIFVTGQQEINYLVRKLRKQFPYYIDTKKEKKTEKSTSKTNNENNDYDDYNDSEYELDMEYVLKNVKKSKKRLASQVSLPKISLDDYKLPTDDTEADLLDNDEQSFNSDIDSVNDLDYDIENGCIGKLIKQPLWVLPLYSLMPSEKQNRIFQPPPENCRLCVVSTNIAETSLTIPHIKYVVDTGKQKTRQYDLITGVSSFVVTFTSKASADQRAGRAGRVSEGHCYRLYSSAKFNDFEDFAVPDIQKKPIDDLMLQMKSMGIYKVINFPFPSPPNTEQLEMAEKRLTILGALEESYISNKNGTERIFKISKLGKSIAAFPVAPRFGKMLALSHQKNLLQYTVCMVSALSVPQVLLENNVNDGKNSTWYNKRKSLGKIGHYKLLGDPWILIRITGESEYAQSRGKLDKFCEDYGISKKGLTEVRKLRIQLTNQINLNIDGVELFVDPEMKPPTDNQARFLRQILLTGMGDQIARKIPRDEIKTKEALRHYKYAYQLTEMEDPVFIHSSSVLKEEQPEWVVFQEAFEIENGNSRKTFIRGITAIEPEWLVLYVPLLCNIRTVREDPQPKYKEDGKIYCYVEATFGRSGWPLPLTEIEMPLSEKACKYFGMFFLNGDVCPELGQYKSKLKSSPDSLIKSWWNLNSYVSNFIRALTSKEINSRKKLFEIWKTEPTYLLHQYVNMLHDVTASELTTIWPPISK